MQSITLVGRALSEPAMTYYESGTVRASFSMIIKGRENQPFGLEIWGKQAELAHNEIKKGTLIGVIGKLLIKPWTDHCGHTTIVSVAVDRLEILGNAPVPALAQEPGL